MKRDSPFYEETMPPHSTFCFPWDAISNEKTQVSSGFKFCLSRGAIKQKSITMGEIKGPIVNPNENPDFPRWKVNPPLISKVMAKNHWNFVCSSMSFFTCPGF